MDSNVNVYVTDKALKKIRFTLDKYLNNEKEYSERDREEFKEAIRLMLKACDNLIKSNGKVYEKIPAWSNILADVGLGGRFDKEAIIEYFCFIYIYSNELVSIHGGGNIVEEALFLTKESFDLLVKIPSGKEYEEKINRKIDLYNKSLRYRLIEERAIAKFEANLADQVKEAIRNEHELIEDIDKRLKVNTDVLEKIENKTGLTSIFSGMKEFSEQIKENLSRVRFSLKIINISICATPVVSFILYLILNPGYGLLLSSVSLMLILSYFLKISLRKEDQYEQILAKLENRMAISIFHKYRMEEIHDDEALSATEKFHALMYKDLETSDWNTPDVSDNLIEIIKAIKK